MVQNNCPELLGLSFLFLYHKIAQARGKHALSIFGVFSSYGHRFGVQFGCGTPKKHRESIGSDVVSQALASEFDKIEATHASELGHISDWNPIGNSLDVLQNSTTFQETLVCALIR